VVVGPITEKEAAFANAKIQELLKKGTNAKTISEILNLLETNSVVAQKKIEELTKKRMSKEMKWLLKQLGKAPAVTYNVLFRPALVELNKKLEKESTIYRTYGGQIRNLFEGVGCILLRIIGTVVQSTAELTQIINNLIKEGTTAYYGETKHEKAFEAIDENAQIIKEFCTNAR
ncbi:hypothetical protein U1Q18_050678, partial [Sarracenia purpurea var. burkii]